MADVLGVVGGFLIYASLFLLLLLVILEFYPQPLTIIHSSSSSSSSPSSSYLHVAHFLLLLLRAVASFTIRPVRIALSTRTPWPISLSSQPRANITIRNLNVPVDAALLAQLEAVRTQGPAAARATAASSVYVPLLYPDILVFPSCIEVLLHNALPFSIVGAVHARTHLVQHAPLRMDQCVDCTVALTHAREHRRGTELDLACTVATHGTDDVKWEAVITILVFHSRASRWQFQPAGLDVPATELGDDVLGPVDWRVEPSLGLQYARVCGDYNPIHVSWLGAKLLGFRSQIAHGMAIVEQVLPVVEDSLAAGSEEPVELFLWFRKPVFLPSRPSLIVRPHTTRSRLFQVYDTRGSICVAGFALTSSTPAALRQASSRLCEECGISRPNFA